MDKIIKTIEDPEIKEIDEKKRIIWHKISVEKKDRMGDIVRIDGIDTKNFKKKPAVLYGHMYGGLDPLPVIGENVGFKKDGKKLYAGTKFLDPEKDGISGKLADLANDLWILNKKRLMGWSVGFIPLEEADLKEGDKVVGIDFKKSELLEYSNVIIPANQDAINDEIKTGAVKKSLLDGLIEVKLNPEELPGDVAVALIEEGETKKDSKQIQELDPVDIKRMFKIVEGIKDTRESFRENLKKILMEEKSK